MSDSIRIRTTPNGGDKYVKLKLDQEFDFIEILSLKLTQEEAYQNFCSDYGVVVGRVIVNSGFGVPNAKVSIFIPLDDVDKDNSLIKGLYPYEVVTDKNSDGIRYNVLPKEAATNNDCFTPVGTLPNKREVLDDETVLEVYCKYYKFTTTTNHAGDFMIFGVPVGNHILHVDVDLSDAGPISQRPYDFTKQGYSQKQFESPTKFKSDTNLDKLPQIKSTNVGINVQPFWGDMDNCEIGITRADVDLNFTVTPSAIFMGSIYGDQNKNSVNKRCFPRAKFGQVCEQTIGSGSIEVIRKNIDGEIEEYTVEGGRVIDDDGTWAFQLPMNLDYMVTDEAGNMIPSADPNVGIPTKASVRFKITMDETGGEGRLRTRAKYLVPNNPQSTGDIDYSFGETTKPTSFKDLYWNKIYTVSNFIPRFQRRFKAASTRNMTGMKDVDDCVGSRNPFPYNRVNTQGNPIFFIICLIIKIIGFIIYIINFILLKIINAIVKLIRGIVDFINSLGANLNKPDYVPCVSVECPADSGYRYAPGCEGCQTGCPDQVKYAGFNQSAANGLPITYYCGDNAGGTCTGSNLLVGLDDCIAFEMAQSLNMFQFDFYNDWVVGTLYSYLLRYRKRRKGAEKFCEFDCKDFTGDPNYTGVDGNKNGTPDNLCFNQELLDTCFNCSPNSLGVSNCQKEYKDTSIREGLIKKYDGELYYAARLHNGNNKLFATDLVCLGSVLECDWQGYPKLQSYLVDSSYKLPPETPEQEQQQNGSNLIVETGMVGISGIPGVFFDINCAGLHVNSRQCLNLRHICEIGVDTDEVIVNPLTNAIIASANGVIGKDEIDDTNEQIRNAYTYINSGVDFPSTYAIPNNVNTNFNINNTNVYYNFASSTNDNGLEYLNFRGYQTDSSYDQPKHSYFMFFGMVPGKSALSKMNSRYFTTCPITVRADISIDTTIVASSDSPCDGTITLDFIGGQPPYYFTVTSSNGSPAYYSGNTETVTTPTLNGRCSGTYVISGTDSLGNSFTKTVSVAGPQAFECLVGVSQNVTTPSGSDGQITVYNIFGGIPPYNYQLFDSNNNIVQTSTVNQTPAIITGLSNGTYKAIVTDSSNTQCITTGLTITGPITLNVSVVKVDASCPNIADGKITLTISGGQPFYTIETVGITDPNFYSSSGAINGLLPGQYQTTVTDNSNPTQTEVKFTTITSPQPLQISSAASNLVYKQCSPNSYTIPFIATDGGIAGSKTIEYRLDQDATWYSVSTNQNYSVPNQAMSFTISPYFSSTITFRMVGVGSCRSNIITYNSIQRPSTALAISSSNKTGPTNNLYTYSLTVIGGIGQYTATTNQQSNVSVNGNNITITSTYSSLAITISDNVGCQVSITL